MTVAPCKDDALGLQVCALTLDTDGIMMLVAFGPDSLCGLTV